jgi:hypothetical protein
MSKYILLYKGPATPMEEFTPEQGEEQMKAWTEWISRCGPAIVEAGSPFGARTAVGDDGGSPQTSELNGYTIVEADTLDGARALVDKHPFLSEGKGRFTIEVFELVPM